MARVTVRFLGRLADQAGTRELVLDLARPVLGELLAEVDRVSGGRLAGELYHAGDRQQLHKSNLFLINGREARFISGLPTTLEEGAIVTLMPMVVGG
jgi:molybdopterin converting factor small subunit